MASTCYQPIADSYPYNLDFQLPKPPAPSDAIALGCAARFDLQQGLHRVQSLLVTDPEIIIISLEQRVLSEFWNFGFLGIVPYTQP